MEPSESEEPVKDWGSIDDRIRAQLYSDEWQDSLPLPFIAAVSTFGTTLTGAFPAQAATSESSILLVSADSDRWISMRLQVT